jgi:hypothetical protein
VLSPSTIEITGGANLVLATSQISGADMDRRRADGRGLQFAAYVEELVSVVGHKDQAGSLRDYCVGLVMPRELRSGNIRDAPRRPRMKSCMKSRGGSIGLNFLLQAEEIAQVVLNALLLPRTAEVTNVEIRPLIKSY